VPAALAAALQTLNAAVADHLRDLPADPGPLLAFHFDALRLQRTVAGCAAHSVFDIERLGDGPAFEARVAMRNVVPATFLAPRFAACDSVTLFSATLGTAAYQRDLLGLPAGTAWIDVPPAFAPAHLVVRAARISTRLPHRQRTLAAVVDLMARQFDAHPGNYLAFFSSFDYLEQAAAQLALRHPDLPRWQQARATAAAPHPGFLEHFVADGRGIGFAVLGGAYAEGVDLPGSRLVGAFVATLGLPPQTAVQAQFRARLDATFGRGHGYADLVPGLQKVVQAAGRVLRSPDDRGWLWLIDDRYLRPEVIALLPPWWGVADSAMPKRAVADPIA
jgi:Rad3-related DNA helicase